MKKLLKYVTPCIGVLALLIGIFSICLIGSSLNSQEAFSASSSPEFSLKDAVVENENISLCRDVIALIENELKSNNTSVVKELQTQIDDYNNLLTLDTKEDKTSLMTLIKVTDAMINNYSAYENSKMTRAEQETNYSTVISAAIAYFKSQKYYLSAELLSFAFENEQLDTHYSIQRKDIIENSSKFKQIALDNKTKGVTSFEKTGSTIDDDLYYAIHGFSFEKPSPTSHTVNIKDRYDFAYVEKPHTTLDQIVNIMYKAQEAGVLVPFQINETISLKTQVDLQKQDSFEETFDVTTGDARHFVVNVYERANLRMQITYSDYSTMIEARCVSVDTDDARDNTLITYTFAIGNAPIVSDVNRITVKFSCE